MEIAERSGQREACAAYVLSQASEGWHLLPDIHDGGGISGGTLERPALQRLLADVADGMGGTPPLGYRPDGRTLAIIEDHAEIVRDIYRRYRELGNVRHVAEQLACEGIDTPQRTSGAGRNFGGCRFSRGQIYFILRNPIYVGDIPHRRQIHKGQVQTLMKSHVQGGRRTR